MRDAILETTLALVSRRGLRSVTMSQIAEETGIGRATLYKYFSGVEPILIAWHERHVAEHLDHLTQLRNDPGEPGARLQAVLHGYALIAFERHQHGAELGALSCIRASTLPVQSSNSLRSLESCWPKLKTAQC